MRGGRRIGCEAWCGGDHPGKLALALGGYGTDSQFISRITEDDS